MLLFLFSGSLAHAQDEAGTVSGVVISTWDGTPLSGVAVTVRGTTLAAQTGADGRFEMKNVPTGDQVLRFSKSGFASAVVTDVRVLLGQNTTVNGNLRPEFYEMEEYEVTAEVFTEQTEQILIERQQSSGMLEAIGAEEFSRLGAGDAADALGRVAGASVTGGKFAVIRGLADRYTSTTMNGTDLPSADPDRKAAQLDLIPSKFIERIDVNKTFRPDLPGGFAGGAIDIVTRQYPDKFQFSLDLGTGYNPQANLRDDFLMTDHGSRDWLAMDDGTRALPGVAKKTTPLGSSPITSSDFKSSFKSTQFAPVPGDSPLNSSFALTIGDSEKVFGHRLGYLAGINYKTDYDSYTDGRIEAFEPGRNDPPKSKSDERSVITYNWSAMASLGLELFEGQDLGFTFLYVRSAEDEARHFRGIYEGYASPADGTYLDQSVLHWTERSLSFYQLNGKHEFPGLGGTRFDWAASLSETLQDEPDYRIFTFIGNPAEQSYDPQGPSVPIYPTRLFRTITEENKSARADLTVPVPSYNSKDNFLKTGVAASQSERRFDSRGFEINRFRGNSFTEGPDGGDPNDFLDPENQPSLQYRNIPANWIYNGDQSISSVYGMADWAAFEWLRLVGGARLENTEINVTSLNTTKNELFTGRIRETDILPSLSGTVFLRTNVLLRLAWSETVVRPTYREIARAQIYDIARGRIYSGTENTRISHSQNYDARIDWYPRSGSLLSAGAFLKKIKDPIELVGEGEVFYVYKNYTPADVRGVEAELRENLGNWWQPLEELTLGLNGALMQSEVTLMKRDRNSRKFWGDTATTRPLYDQPDYTFNSDLTWDHKRTGTALTVALSVVGPRLVAAGVASPDDIEQPAPQLDVFLTQRLGKHWKVKFSAKNLLDPRCETTQNWPGAGERVVKTYSKGMTFGLSVGCEF